MTNAFFIAAFGALGCLGRYYLSGWVYHHLGRAFPYGSLAVNSIGAFLIGVVMEYGLRSTLISQNLRVGLVIGFMGGLTTFSAFSYETIKLVEDSQFFTAFVNVMASVALCLLLTWAGILVARQLT